MTGFFGDTALATQFGFYRWEEDPCRLVEGPPEEGGMYAEIYIAGKGFCAIDPFDLLQEGVRISETEFKARVQQEIVLARRGTVNGC